MSLPIQAVHSELVNLFQGTEVLPIHKSFIDKMQKYRIHTSAQIFLPYSVPNDVHKKISSISSLEKSTQTSFSCRQTPRHMPFEHIYKMMAAHQSHYKLEQAQVHQI